MIITIPSLLPETIADQIVADLNSLEWRAGETDDAEYAALVKRNLELKEQDNPIVAQYGKLVPRSGYPAESVNSAAPAARRGGVLSEEHGVYTGFPSTHAPVAEFYHSIERRKRK